jgi:transitional endoplasmic reticulum ATPase
VEDYQMETEDLKKIKVSISKEKDKNERLVLRQCADYMQRLISRYSLLDQETMEILHWILRDDMQKIVRALHRELRGSQKNEFATDVKDAGELLEHYLRDHLKKSPKSIQFRMRNIIVDLLQQQIKKLAFKGKSGLEKSLEVSRKMFHLNDQEIKFCLFLLITSGWRSTENYFVDHLECSNLSGRKYLATLLDIGPSDLSAILRGTMNRIGLLEMDRHSLTIQEDYLEFLNQPSTRFLAKKFFARLSGRTIPLGHYLIDPDQTEYILKLLKEKPKTSTHILLYGSPGTGKSSYAQGLARELNIPAYQIIQDEENTSRKRRAAIMACLNMANQGEGSLMVVDEADNILNTRFTWFSHGETQDKGWLNQLLEEPGARMIWITNSIEEMEESVLRRFAFSLQFKPFNQQQRIQLWGKILKGQKAKGCLDASEIVDLAKKYKVSAGAISLAVKKALESKTRSKNEFKPAIALALEAHQTLLNQGEKRIDKNQIERHYSLEGLNMEGEVHSIISQLKAFEHYLRQSTKEQIMNMNLLFYGSPGTGKSELARYIAQVLEREIIVRRASDLLDCYVGMTEKNIKAAFEEAEREEALLIIDEADSLLFNREQAVRSWEVSQTNEFLTRMEKFRGILICTTNRLTALDNASIRRFNYKIKFNPLTSEGNVVFYYKLLAPLLKNPISMDVEESLKRIVALSPGDFKVVRDRFSFMPEEKINHSNLIQALKEEAELKRSLTGRKAIGF